MCLKHFVKQKIGFYGLLLLLAFVGVGCNDAPIDGENEPKQTATISELLPQEGYPAPTSITDSYPPPILATATPSGYPSPKELPADWEQFQFRFDAGLKVGDTTVSGQAPPNLSWAIVDVTLNGAILGSGRTDGDGRFSILVAALPAGRRIGITLAELPEGKTMEQISQELFAYRGESFMNLPSVGIFFETALVE